MTTVLSGYGSQLSLLYRSALFCVWALGYITVLSQRIYTPVVMVVVDEGGGGTRVQRLPFVVLISLLLYVFTANFANSHKLGLQTRS